jgi:3D (Asp-Asp-Asp) domain-containing protein
MPAAAERARTEGLTDLPSASPAAGQVTHAHSPVASVVRPPVTTMLMEVTAYCPCTRCCGPQAQGITASGKRVDYNGGLFVAADPKHKFGTKLVIPGYAGNRPVEVIDRGGAIKGNKLDVYFDSHEEARQWGRRTLLVELVE